MVLENEVQYLPKIFGQLGKGEQRKPTSDYPFRSSLTLS